MITVITIRKYDLFIRPADDSSPRAPSSISRHDFAVDWKPGTSQTGI